MSDKPENNLGITHYFGEIVGSSQNNDDGSSRREILSRCRPGEALECVLTSVAGLTAPQVLVRRLSNNEIVGVLSADAAQKVDASLRQQRKVVGHYLGRSANEDRLRRGPPRVVIFAFPDGTTKAQLTQYFRARRLQITGMTYPSRLREVFEIDSEQAKKRGAELRTQFPSALEAGVTSLFKFRAYSDQYPKDKQYLHETLELGRVYMPRPAQINDPWEFRPAFTLEELDDAGLEKLRREMVEVELRFTPGSTRARAKHETNRRLANLKQFSEVARNAYLDAMSYTRVYCVSSTNQHPLLWTHYSANHTGLCIEFDASKFPFTEARQVAYSDEYPTLPFMAKADRLFPAEFTKASFWAYEAEFRLKAHEEIVDLQPKGYERGFLTFPRNCIRAIYFGCRSEPRDRAEVREFAERNDLDIDYYLADVANDRYELEFRKLP